MSVDYGLIFDVGMHKGHDSFYYLSKGFRVVGVEAREDLFDLASSSLNWWITSGQMNPIHRALDDVDGREVVLWVNRAHDDWASLDRAEASKGGDDLVEALVATSISLDRLVDQFGIPYYIKCDIEGGEDILLRGLQRLECLPPFVSIELRAVGQLDVLIDLGYKRFQLRNQFMNPFIRNEREGYEGMAAQVEFSHEHSGPFGRELQPEEWFKPSVALERSRLWLETSSADRNLVAHSWLDLHASLSAAPESSNSL